MWNWLFGDDKAPQRQQPKKAKASKPKPPAQPKVDVPKEEEWIFQFLVEFLSSPLWKEKVYQFIDNNCILFSREEENQLQHLQIHKQFKGLVCGLFDAMVESVGISDELCQKMVEAGLAHKKYSPVFNQLIIADDFLKFKNVMINRNQRLQELQQKLTAKESRRGASEEQQLKQLLEESRRLEQLRQEAEEKQLLQMVRQFQLQESQKAKSESTPQPPSILSQTNVVLQPAEQKEEAAESPEERRKRLLEQRNRLLSKLAQEREKKAESEEKLVKMEPGLQGEDQSSKRTLLMRKIRMQLEEDL